MAIEKQLASCLAYLDSVQPVVSHAAFCISPASFDEITRILRAREYHHVFDDANGAIYMDNIALTRGEPAPAAQFCSAVLLENSKPGADHRYLSIDDEGVPRSTTDVDKALRFSRDEDAITFAKLVTNLGPVCSPTSWAPVQHLWG